MPAGRRQFWARCFLSWPRFAGLLVVLYLARGVLLLAVLPPFEAWDEYQHLGYVAFLAEHDRQPTFADALPESLVPALRSVPHGPFAARQLRSVGVRTWEDFWAHPREPLEGRGRRMRFYQAQHPPLYYRLAMPLWRALDGDARPLAAMAALRVANLLLGAAAVAVALVGVRRLFVDQRLARQAGLLIALQPLLLLGVARVSNDALAQLAATIAVVVLLRGVGSYLTRGAIAGLVSGVSVLARGTSIVLLPFGLLALSVQARRRRLPVRTVVGGVVLFLIGHLAMTWPQYRDNLAQYGAPVATQEAAWIADHAPGAFSYLGAALSRDFWIAQPRLWLRDMLWVGGWSYLKLPLPFYLLHAALMLAAAAGWLRRGAPGGLDPPGSAGLLSALVALSAAGLAFHAVQSLLAWGFVATNAWYALPALPWLLCLVVAGAARIPGRIPDLLVPLLALTFVFGEIAGLLVRMVPTYTATVGPSLAWDRLASMHQSFPGVGVGAVALVSVLILAVWAFRAGLRPPAEQP
jgi:hypothetical protein